MLETALELFDWKRMFFGEASPFFLLEILIRTSIIYVYTLVLLRWLGSRTIGQLSTIEFLLVIALGSAVGDAMFYPDVPLIHALAVITIVVVANKALDSIIDRSERAERLIDGSATEAVRNGVVSREFMDNNTISRAELFQQLREHGVEHLGQIAQAYLETDGRLTVFRAGVEKPGLPIVPPWEIVAPVEIKPGNSSGEPAACKNCGTLEKMASQRCSHCGNETWVRARMN